MLTLLAFKCQQHYGGGGRDSAGHRAFVGDRVLRSRLVRTCDDSFQSMAILTVPQSVGARTPTTTLDPTLIGKIVTTVTDSGTEPEHRGPLASHRSSSMQFGTMRATGVSSFFLIAAAGPWSPDVFSFFREPYRTLRDCGSATRVRTRRASVMKEKAAVGRAERVQFMLTRDELEAVDNFRFSHRMPSRAAAVRELLRLALRALKEPRKRR